MSQLTETQTLLHDIPESRKSSVDSRRPSRRISRAYEIRPSYRSEKPLYDWLCEHLDKQTVNLVINFLVLITLLALLTIILSHLAH
ncbi:hypothetical protein T4E_1388 [Trichinella pseudospiralis]|uniref:Uncharacterized protein n=1 Tax=Trichinella pseudospiralis TaxID=6337 RepID=A0A0V0YH63_TRIPS|nr:hypothetical protein T4E_1388 [Trichinella pseudospiralis]KRY92729.1 hypothetical protein T4D_9541 [Trichinella pseudospiralis]